jgi:hypothetical protein
MVNPGLQPVEQQMAESVWICGSSLFRVGSAGVKSVPRRSSILTETEKQKGFEQKALKITMQHSRNQNRAVRK